MYTIAEPSLMASGCPLSGSIVAALYVAAFCSKLSFPSSVQEHFLEESSTSQPSGRSSGSLNTRVLTLLPLELMITGIFSIVSPGFAVRASGSIVKSAFVSYSLSSAFLVAAPSSTSSILILGCTAGTPPAALTVKEEANALVTIEVLITKDVTAASSFFIVHFLSEQKILYFIKIT